MPNTVPWSAATAPTRPKNSTAIGQYSARGRPLTARFFGEPNTSGPAPTIPARRMICPR